MTETETPAHPDIPARRKGSGRGLGSVLKAILPEAWYRHLKAMRDLDMPARWTYLGWRFRRPRPMRGEPPPSSVLFVCYGNIIRSALAEQLLRREWNERGVRETVVRSAGVHARPGRAADVRAIRLAPEFGVSLEAHRASPLTEESIAAAEVIIVMDYLNQAELIARYPSAGSRVRLIGEYMAGGEFLELPDPYMEDEGAVRATFVQLDRAVRSLASRYPSISGGVI